MITQSLDIAENIIPAPAIQASNMIAQHIEDFFHLKSRWKCLNQNRRFNRSIRNIENRLREVKDIIP